MPFLDHKVCCLSMYNLDIIYILLYSSIHLDLYQDQLRERPSLIVLMCINVRKIPSESLSKNEFEFAFMS